MTRLYGRAPMGQRIRDRVPGGHWKMLTILGAMDHTGMLATMTVEAATDGEVFLAFLEQVLCPKLRPGHVVLMDNLSAHKVDGVRQRIEACGATVLYLPPYSPDLNPIEKARLRALAARAMPQLEHATAQALQTITPSDAQAWLRLRFGNYT
jgi:transposase